MTSVPNETAQPAEKKKTPSPTCQLKPKADVECAYTVTGVPTYTGLLLLWEKGRHFYPPICFFFYIHFRSKIYIPSAAIKGRRFRGYIAERRPLTAAEGI